MNNPLEIASNIAYQEYTTNEKQMHYCDREFIPLLKFMTGLDWSQGSNNQNALEIFLVDETSEKKRKIRSEAKIEKVALLSGGLDSLAGVAYLIKNNLLNNIAFVNYNTKQSDTRNAKNVIKYLKEVYPDNNIHFFEFKEKKDIKIKSNVQRTRSFWFMACVKEISNKYNVNKVYLFENGVVSMNHRATFDRSLTRTTHPKTINYFREIFNLNITTPFQYMTKGEVIKLIIESPLKSLIKNSNTCAKGKNFVNTWLTNDSKVLLNCGICYSCMIRRIGEMHNNYYETKYAIETTNKKLTVKMILDFNSLTNYFIHLKKDINNAKCMEWHYNSDTEIIKMFQRFEKELDKGEVIWK